MSEPEKTANHQAKTPMAWRLSIAVVALAFAAFGFWGQAELQKRKQPVMASAQLYPQPKQLVPFSLNGGDGKVFGLDRWKDGWDLVFFGFTNCPDFCPNTLNLLHQLDTEMRGRGDPVKMPQVTFISVDPERDSPEKLAEYVAYFDPAFMSATGSPQQLTDLTRQLGAIYFIEERQQDQPNYAVDHSSSILLIDPQARLFARFSAPHDIDLMAADLTTIIRDN